MAGPSLLLLIAALLLAIAAWGVAEIYGVVIKGSSTDQQDRQAPAVTSPNPASTDPVQSQSDSQPIDQNPKVDKNPTPAQGVTSKGCSRHNPLHIKP